MKAMQMSDNRIVQYYIVRKDLQMSTGKIAAQCAHGAQIFAQNYEQDKIAFSKVYPNGGAKWNQHQLTTKWITSEYTKIILIAKDSIFQKIKEEVNYAVLIVDAGFTEINAGEETVLVLHPVYKENAPKIIQKLRLL